MRFDAVIYAQRTAMNLDTLIKIYQVWRGKSYVRFARYCLLIGAGLLAGPQTWQFIVVTVLAGLQLVYGPASEPASVPLPDSGIAGQLVGLGLCVTAVILFCYFYKAEIRALETAQAGAWVSLESLWKGMRDLHVPPAEVNQDDVATAIQIINLSGITLKDQPELITQFRERYGEDYKTLFKKLKQHKYKLPHYVPTSDLLLNEASHKLAEKLEKP